MTNTNSTLTQICKCKKIYMHSRNPLNQHPPDRAGARLWENLYWHKFLETIFYLFTYQLFSCHHTRLTFFNYHRPGHGFSDGTHCCKPRTQHLFHLH